MKKKVLMAILPLCLAMAMTACGGNADTKEAAETAAAEESAEAGAQEEAEAGEQAQTEETGAETGEQEQTEEADAYYEAGRKSLYGLNGAQIDMEDACTNFIKAQELGNTDANFYLGALADANFYLVYQTGHFDILELDFEQVRAYYEQSGDNPYAQIALGCLYYWGNGVEQDMEKAKELFQSAVDQGIVEGYLGLAIAAGNEGDFETALEYYNKVVEDGTEQLYIASAMTALGYMYRFDEGVEQDGAKAVEWYTKAADMGNANAMYNLGLIYANGEGVEQDGPKAVEWYTKAVDSGYTIAMNNLGDMYMYGEGVEQDYAKAIEWYKKAADMGDASAMNSLGGMYENGFGVEQDDAEAIEWYKKAVDSGGPGGIAAKNNLERLQGQ